MLSISLFISLMKILIPYEKVDTSHYVILRYHPGDNYYTNFPEGAKPAELTSREVDDMEGILVKAIHTYNAKALDISSVRKLEKYWRQYIPFINSSGQKEVWINFICQPAPVWKQEVVRILDGGNCFFNVKINLVTRKVYDLFVEGDP